MGLYLEHLDYLEKVSWDLYKLEHDRKDKIYATAGLPFSAMTLVLGGIGYLVPRLPGGIDWSSPDLKSAIIAGIWLLAAVSCFCFGWCVVLAKRMIADNEYRYVPEPIEIAAYAKKMEDFYKSDNDYSAEERAQRVAMELRLLMVDEAGTATQMSADVNDQRVVWRVALWKYLFYSGIFVVFAIAGCEVVSRWFAASQLTYCG